MKLKYSLYKINKYDYAFDCAVYISESINYVLSEFFNYFHEFDLIKRERVSLIANCNLQYYLGYCKWKVY